MSGVDNADDISTGENANGNGTGVDNSPPIVVPDDSTQSTEQPPLADEPGIVTPSGLNLGSIFDGQGSQESLYGDARDHLNSVPTDEEQKDLFTQGVQPDVSRVAGSHDGGTRPAVQQKNITVDPLLIVKMQEEHDQLLATQMSRDDENAALLRRQQELEAIVADKEACAAELSRQLKAVSVGTHHLAATPRTTLRPPFPNALGMEKPRCAMNLQPVSANPLYQRRHSPDLSTVASESVTAQATPQVDNTAAMVTELYQNIDTVKSILARQHQGQVHPVQASLNATPSNVELQAQADIARLHAQLEETKKAHSEQLKKSEEDNVILQKKAKEYKHKLAKAILQPQPVAQPKFYQDFTTANDGPAFELVAQPAVRPKERVPLAPTMSAAQADNEQFPRIDENAPSAAAKGCVKKRITAFKFIVDIHNEFVSKYADYTKWTKVVWISAKKAQDLITMHSATFDTSVMQKRTDYESDDSEMEELERAWQLEDQRVQIAKSNIACLIELYEAEENRSHQQSVSLEMSRLTNNPKAKFPIFDGINRNRFSAWMSTFEETFMTHHYTPAQQVQFLKEYTSDGVADIIRESLNMEPSTGIAHAITQLKEVFLNEFAVTRHNAQRLSRTMGMGGDLEPKTIRKIVSVYSALKENGDCCTNMDNCAFAMEIVYSKLTPNTMLNFKKDLANQHGPSHVPTASEIIDWLSSTVTLLENESPPSQIENATAKPKRKGGPTPVNAATVEQAKLVKPKNISSSAFSNGKSSNDKDGNVPVGKSSNDKAVDSQVDDVVKTSQDRANLPQKKDGKPLCVLCLDDVIYHKFLDCVVFKGMKWQVKVAFIESDGRCLCCLNKRHKGNCYGYTRCKHCGSDQHNQMLCKRWKVNIDLGLPAEN